MKSNTRHIADHLVWRGLYFFSVLLLNIGIARVFAADQSGHIFYIVNNLALVLLLVSISLESGSTYYIASGKIDASLMANFCLVWAAIASITAIGGWYIILLFSHAANSKDSGFILSCFLFILGVLLTTYFTALFYAKKQFGLPNKILFGVNLLLIILLVLGKQTILVRDHFIQLYFFFFFLQGIGLMLFFFSRYPRLPGAWMPSLSILTDVIRYSLAALLANGIYFLVNRIDYWFVQYYCSGTDLGNYIQASKLGQMLLVVPSILAATLFPIFSSGEKTGNSQNLTAVMRVLFWINLLICIIILCTGWFIFPLVFGSSFGKMYILFALLGPGILSVTLNYPLAAWFSANKRIGINIRGSVLALIVICAGNWITLPQYGVTAASVISSAGYFTYFIYTFSMYKKQQSLSAMDILMIRKSDIHHILQSVNSKTIKPQPENVVAQNLIP